MKKAISILLVLVMTALLLAGCGAKKEETAAPAQTEAPAASASAPAASDSAPAASDSAPAAADTAPAEADAEAEQFSEEREAISDSTGVLAFLNFTETQFGRWSVLFNYLGNSLIENGYVISDLVWANPDAEATLEIPYYPVIYYDSLDAMIMGLLSGEIYSFDIYSCVADYICSRNDQLVNYITYDMTKERTPFVQAVFDRFENGFSFMMLDSRSELRDEFNTAIQAMKDDGTMDKLIQEHITDVVNGAEPVPIELPKVKGQETIRVAVTGSLPPMDYVAADGTFAGFNTAILAEIGNRIGKNMELVQVDCLGRATALASGNVDVVFWIRGDKAGETYAQMTDEEYAAYKAGLEAQFTEEEKHAMEIMEEAMPRPMDYTKDMPDGTIITIPYYTDIPVGIMSRDMYDWYIAYIQSLFAEN